MERTATEIRLLEVIAAAEIHVRRALMLTSTDYQDPVGFHLCRALDALTGGSGNV